MAENRRSTVKWHADFHCHKLDEAGALEIYLRAKGVLIAICSRFDRSGPYHQRCALHTSLAISLRPAITSSLLGFLSFSFQGVRFHYTTKYSPLPSRAGSAHWLTFPPIKQTWGQCAAATASTTLSDYRGRRGSRLAMRAPSTSDSAYCLQKILNLITAP